MFKKIGISLIAAFSIGFAFLLILSNSDETKHEILNNQPSAEIPVEKKALFAIYTNGTFRVFTASMYHNLSDDVFIEPSNPNVVIVNKDGITWRDLFATLPMELDENCLITGTKQTFCSNGQFSLQFYINGKRNQKALDQIINSKDKLLITYESEDSLKIKPQIDSFPDLK